MTGAELFTRGGQACPVCGGLVDRPLELGDFRLAGCRACGSFASDALGTGAATSFEPERYFANAEADHARWGDLLRRVSGAVSNEEPRVTSLLDVGCGTGAFLQFAATRLTLASAAGIELDAGRAAQARESNPSARIHVGDAVATLAGIPGTFDLITLWDVLEHVPAPGELIDALAGKLSPTGAIVIQTINERSLMPAVGRLSYGLTGGRVTSLARRTHEPHHLVFFSRAGLGLLARRSGLRLRDCWFDRLDYARIDGNRLVAAAAATAMALENALGGGLFINVILDRDPAAAGSASRPAPQSAAARD